MEKEDTAFEYLKNCAASGKSASAYIFIGGDEEPKIRTALEFAKILNCEKGGIDSCGICPACTRIESGNYPDLYWMKQEEKGSVVKIEAIRSLINDVYLKPFEGRKKIFVIEAADNMTEEASNCLLKTLEEPPLDSVLILMAQDAAKFLPTVVSRCKILKFSAYGSMRASGMKNSWKEEVIKKFAEEGILPQGYAREELIMAIDAIYEWHRDILLARCGAYEQLLNSDKIEELKSSAESLSFDEIMKRIKSIENIYYAVKHNANTDLAQAALSINLS